MSKGLAANPERHSEIEPDAPHTSNMATLAEPASGTSNRKPPHATSAEFCISLRTYVRERPATISRSAVTPPTLPMMKYNAHGAADNSPAFASDTPNDDLK